MNAFIAIDGGGSGSRALLRRSGYADEVAEDGPANAFTDPAAAAGTITRLAAALVERAGIDMPPVTAGLAGCRLPEIAEDFTRRLPFPARVVDDSVTAAHGALGDKDGTLISLGTGSFFLRKSADKLRHIGGWGLSLGDVASGAWFGREALTATLRAADGLIPSDALTEALADPHPLLRYENLGPAEFAALAPMVFKMADTATAQSLIARARTEITSALTALGARETEPIVLIGGLAPAMTPHLPAPVQARLVAAQGNPLDGACALAERFR